MNELQKSTQDAEERIEQLKAQATRTTALLDGLPHGSTMRSKIEESVVKLQSVIVEIEVDCIELVTLHNQFRAELCTLPPKEALILQMRYLDGNNFNRIAKTLRLSTARVFYYHRHGLKIILTNDSSATVPQQSGDSNPTA